jgi:signal transduction histidine kinase
MRERVVELGGSLEVVSESPGTSVKVKLSIAKPESGKAPPMESSVDRSSAA